MMKFNTRILFLNLDSPSCISLIKDSKQKALIWRYVVSYGTKSTSNAKELWLFPSGSFMWTHKKL